MFDDGTRGPFELTLLDYAICSASLGLVSACCLLAYSFIRCSELFVCLVSQLSLTWLHFVIVVVVVCSP